MFALKLFFETEGFEVIPAYDGRQALDILADSALRPDLILLDIMMPVLDGWSVLRAIRADDRLSSIPVVALTALSKPEDVALAWQLGVGWHQAKPIDQQLLLSIVQGNLRDVDTGSEEAGPSPNPQ